MGRRAPARVADEPEEGASRLEEAMRVDGLIAYAAHAVAVVGGGVEYRRRARPLLLRDLEERLATLVVILHDVEKLGHCRLPLLRRRGELACLEEHRVPSEGGGCGPRG